MKKLGTWDSYVKQSVPKEDRAVELPLTDDEVYVIQYPTRRQGKQIAKAQREGDTDALVVALLGEDAGHRVVELAEDEPGEVLDKLLVDVLAKFGFVDDESDVAADEDEDEVEAGNPPQAAQASKRSGGRRSSSAA